MAGDRKRTGLIMSDSKAWTTVDELNHIQHIMHEQEIELITWYIEGIQKRTAWQGIDREKVMAYAKAALEQFKPAYG